MSSRDIYIVEGHRSGGRVHLQRYNFRGDSYCGLIRHGKWRRGSDGEVTCRKCMKVVQRRAMRRLIRELDSAHKSIPASWGGGGDL